MCIFQQVDAGLMFAMPVQGWSLHAWGAGIVHETTWEQAVAETGCAPSAYWRLSRSYRCS